MPSFLDKELTETSADAPEKRDYPQGSIVQGLLGNDKPHNL